MLKNLYLIKNGQAQLKLYALSTASEVIKNTLRELSASIRRLSGAEVELCFVENFHGVKHGVVFALFSEVDSPYEGFEKDRDFLTDSDGFAVRQAEDTVYVLSHEPSGVFFGGHDLLEKNADILWYRGKAGANEALCPTKDIALTNASYVEKPFMKMRGWNMCGIGKQGGHLDIDSVLYYAKNKINYKCGSYDGEYAKFGMKSVMHILKGVHNFSEYTATNPEYFMREKDGTPRKNYGSISFLNYYDKRVAELYAEKIIAALKESPDSWESYINLEIPDDNFFRMWDGEKLLSELPFTADDGATVYPTEENYKSTVYFNFLNRAVKIIGESFPKVRFVSLAYLYAEYCPAIAVDKRIVVGVCPISANDHLSYKNPSSKKDEEIIQNIRSWVDKGVEVAIYAYWESCAAGHDYPRPIAKVARENILLFKEWGVNCLTPEGILDGYSRNRPETIDRGFDVNGLYIWLQNKLFWDPFVDLDALTERYCRLVYGKAGEDMLHFYNLIQKGWDEGDAYVFCATGVDVYLREFILKAGIKEGVLGALRSALEKELTQEQRRQISYLYENLKGKIEKVESIRDEIAEATYSPLGIEEILSPAQLAIEENGDSVWNKAQRLTSFYDYTTFQPYDERAKLNARMLWDEEYLYIGFQVFDDKLSSAPPTYNERGQAFAYREDGSKVNSYVETYVGGNVLNMIEYYGYISGVFKKETDLGVYLNDGAPKGIPLPKRFKEGFYFHYDEVPEKRYYFHVQAISWEDLTVTYKDARPYGSFVYYTDRYGRVGWKGNGLWAKQGFTEFKLLK